MGFYKRVFTLAAFVLLCGCNTTQIGTLYQRSWHTAAPAAQAPARDLFVTVDGTSNTPVARTNASRLYEIVDSYAGAANREVATYYAEGVGSNGNPLGLVGALGMSDDIRNAYEFLTLHYNTNDRTRDRIFLNGYSRGAYAVRVVGGMVAVAGIPDLSKVSTKKRRRMVDDIFDAFKTGRRSGETRKDHFDRRVRRVKEAMESHGLTPRTGPNETRIAAMTLWDTVEAVGLPDFTHDPREEVTHYHLTNCNVDLVLHALALDDNRAQNFTPIMADAYHMWMPCEDSQATGSVKEVWFAGSHADVGGTYATRDGIVDHLHGVSLNWMLGHLEKRGFGLFPPGYRVFEDPFAAIHDARTGNFSYKLFRWISRNPMDYHTLAYTLKERDKDEVIRRLQESDRPIIHKSAIARLRIARGLDTLFAPCPNPDRADQKTRSLRRPRLPDRKYGLLCASELEQHGIVAEWRKAEKCLDESWPHGFRLRKDQPCVHFAGDEPVEWPDLPGAPGTPRVPRPPRVP